jgi:energy-coupling factor transport system ATP-binding protein
VRDELEVGPRALRRPDAEVAAVRDRLAQRLRLAHLLDANPFTLSGGEKRRLSVATALATAPRVLVADEPSFGQDALTWAELVRLLDELVAEGTALVTVTHDLALVDALADERFVLPAAAREVVR